jgi:electron transfer flavoprotein beta subunit
MRILACLKQVHEPESLFDIKDGLVAWRPPARMRLSSLDEFALEMGLRIKDADPTAELWAVTVGPESADHVLRRALGMGADQAAHIKAPEEPAPRPLAVASALAAWAGPQSFDLILCGVMSEDAMQGMVGPMLARLLNMPWATAVSHLEMANEGRAVIAEREMEGGRRQVLELPLPALLTIQSSPNQPRYPALSKLLMAKKASIPTFHLADLPTLEEREALSTVELPGRKRDGVFLEGSASEKAVKLLELLRQRALL